jgi:mannitol/fructose-specific phosphotransferase system IIA component (Ntr-type)
MQEIRLPSQGNDSNHSPPPQMTADLYFQFMKLAKLLCAEHIILDMKAVEHWPSIVELVGHLVTTRQLPHSQLDEMLDAFRAREERVSTGIGSGVAIPHAFSDHLDQVVAVFGRSSVGIDFEALDNAPVHFIILFIVPRKDYHMHLMTLAAIAKMFTNSEIRRQLGAAETLEEILAIFDSKPARAGNPFERSQPNLS